MRRSLAGTFVLLMAAVAAAGCTTPGATPGPTPTPVASGGASSSMTPSATGETPLPSLPAIPDGLPVMPGAVAADSPPPAESGTIAGWVVDAIGPDVYQFYLDALPAAGFVIRGRYPGGNVAIIRFTAPDESTLDLALVGEGDGEQTRILLRLPEGP